MHTAKKLPWPLQQADKDMLMNTQAILAPPFTVQLPALCCPQRIIPGSTYLVTGGKGSWQGGTKYRIDREDAHHCLHNRSGEDTLTKTRAILVLPLSLIPLLLVAPDGSFRGQRTKLPAREAIGRGGPNIVQTAKMLVIASK